MNLTLYNQAFTNTRSLKKNLNSIIIIIWVHIINNIKCYLIKYFKFNVKIVSKKKKKGRIKKVVVNKLKHIKVNSY